jgi:NAD(P)-dependent dehydrogenase (short-subunit alcohol dehydrogenase family)
LAASAIPSAHGGDSKEESGRFAGQVVAITGATSGIGAAAARLFAAEGASVAFCGRREDLGKTVEAGFSRAPGANKTKRAAIAALFFSVQCGCM